MNARSLSRTPLHAAVLVALCCVLWALVGASSTPPRGDRLTELHYSEAARRLEVADFEAANPILAGQIIQACEAASLCRDWSERQPNLEYREIFADVLETMAEHFQAESDALRGQ